MTKAGLASRIAEKTGMTGKDAYIVLTALIAALTETLQEGDLVSIPKPGSFEVRTRAARTGRNPRTGEAVSIPENRIPAFKPGKALKDAVR